MATKNIVPRADGEGSLGTSAKKWGAIYADSIVLADEETLAQKISAQNTRITTAEGNVTTLSGTVETLSGDVTTLYGDIEELSDGKLNLSGGTMTGAINFASGDFSIDKSSNEDNVDVGWNYSDRKGAILGLRGANHTNSGVFSIYARNATGSSVFSGFPNGSLTWSGKEVERVNASGAYYIRYESGLQICWGTTGGLTANTAKTVTLAASFKDSNYVVAALRNAGDTTLPSTMGELGRKRTTSNFEFVSTGSTNYTYIAIGLWK